MPIIDFSVQAGNTFATMEQFHRQASTLGVDLNQMAVIFREVSNNGETFTTKLTGLTAAGQRLTSTFQKQGDELTIVNQRLTENVAAMKSATAAAQARARAGDAQTARTLLTQRTNTAGLGSSDLASVGTKINSIVAMVRRGEATLGDFTTAAAAAAGEFPLEVLNDAEHKLVASIRRIDSITSRATVTAQAKLATQRSRAINLQAGQTVNTQLQTQFGARLATAEPAVVASVRKQFDQIQALFSRGLNTQQFQNAFNVAFNGSTHVLDDLENSVRQHLQRIQLDLNRPVRGSRARPVEAANARSLLTARTNTAGLTQKDAISVSSQIDSITNRIDRGRATLDNYVRAAAIASGAVLATPLNETEQRILRSIQRIDSITTRATTTAQERLARQRVRETNIQAGQNVNQRLQVHFGPQLGGVNFATAERVRRQFDQIQALFSRGLDTTQYQNAFNVVFNGSNRVLNDTENNVRRHLQQIQIELNRPIRAQPAQARPGEARQVRQLLTQRTNFSGLSAADANSINSRIDAVTGRVERGRATLQNYVNAVNAATVGLAPGARLSEAEQRLLRFIQKIDSVTDAATRRAQAQLSRSREQGQADIYGRLTASRLQRQVAPDIQLISPAAQERVRQQIAQIRGLFSRGLTPAGYRAAFQSYVDGGIQNLGRLENEARHRLEQIRLELNKAPQGGFLNNLFGGGGGGKGVVGKIGGASINNVVGGLFLAQGVERLGESLKSSLNDAADFEKHIALLRTLSQDTKGTFDQWATSILKVSEAVGKSREEIAAAGYDLLSNQVTKGVADTEAALTSVAKFAVVTNATTQDTGNLLSSVINSYGYTAGNTDQILNKLFTTIDLGRIKASDLANSMGRPLVAARALGATFEELAAAQITISQTGLGAEQTNTLITNVFHKMLNPTKELQKVYDDLGVATGENFVKTYGFAGALKKLTEVTGGSSTKIAELFNEIRGEQGFTQLSTRLGIFTDALYKLQKEEDPTKGLFGALKEFEKLPGQRFREELQKLDNVFLKLKDIALRALIEITDRFGGLGDNMIALIGLSVAFGAALATAAGIHAFQTLTADATVFAATLAGIRTTLLSFGAISIGTGIGVGLGVLLAQHSNRVNAAANAQAEALVEIDKLNKEIASSNEVALADSEKVITKIQGKALEYVNKTRTALATIATKQQEVFKTASEDLKNSLELASRAFKKVIEDGETAEKAALDNVDKRRERQFHRKSTFQDDVFERQKKVNEINVGQGGTDRENSIYKSRIGQLTRQARDFVIKGRPQDIDKVLERIGKAKDLAKERANLTVHDAFGNEVFKYANGWRLVNQLTAYEGKLIDENAKRSKKAGDDLRVENDKKRAELKKYQDLAEEVVNFQVFNKEGKFQFKDAEDALKKYDEKVAALKEQEGRITAPEHITRAGAIGDAESLRFNKERVKRDLADQRNRIAPLLDTHEAQEEAEKQQFAVTKRFADEQQRARDLAARKTQAGQEYTGAQQSAIAGLDALQEGTKLSFIDKAVNKFSGSVLFEDNTNLLPPDIRALTALARDATARNDINEGLRILQLARTKLAQRGGENVPFRDQGGNDEIPGPNGTKQKSTIGTYLAGLSTQLQVAKGAQRQGQEVGLASSNQLTEVENYLTKLTNTSDKFDTLNRVVQGWETTSSDAFRAVNAEAQSLFETMTRLNKQMEMATSAAFSIGKIQFEQGENSRGGATQPIGKGTVLREFTGGQVHYYAEGGMLHDFVNGAYKQGSDNIPIMGSDREVMMNQRASDRFLPQLIAMNAGFDPSYSSGKSGGQTYNFGEMHFHIKGGESTTQTTREMASALRREIRRGNLELN